MDLFDQQEGKDKEPQRKSSPLAARMRPASLDEIVGQEHILGPGKLLRRAIEADRMGSIILYGSPGCGKTSLAEVIAGATARAFERSSGVMSNVAILRGLLQAAQQRKLFRGQETILFIDEIHRFNKAQQDVLLPYVEDGSITLIGATTHNPSFFINTPLVSRSQIFQLNPLTEEAVVTLLERAIVSERGLGPMRVRADAEALRHLARVCEGDARRALSALEIAALTTDPDADGFVMITRETAEESIQKKRVAYDHDEDEHHDTISAFIKSVRGSDPDAALYWLAKMIEAGEDPRFIARRLIILASEDVGNADPRGLTVAVSALQAVDFVGMPEGRITLAQVVTYLATAPKSNASYLAIDSALQDVRSGRTLPVPDHLKSRPVVKPEKGYQYAHDHEGHFVEQEYVPTSKIYYRPEGMGYEETILKRLDVWRTRLKKKEAQ
ncbi:MAG: replication-associated recombination protein A [Kiritimatiellae bacterium]|nr:replication-associated recombination protein A [Kiritimatiellia bacterium]